jgi:hypothetical protein
MTCAGQRLWSLASAAICGASFRHLPSHLHPTEEHSRFTNHARQIQHRTLAGVQHFTQIESLLHFRPVTHFPANAHLPHLAHSKQITSTASTLSQHERQRLHKACIALGTRLKGAKYLAITPHPTLRDENCVWTVIPQATWLKSTTTASKPTVTNYESDRLRSHCTSMILMMPNERFWS